MRGIRYYKLGMVLLDDMRVVFEAAALPKLAVDLIMLQASSGA